MKLARLLLLAASVAVANALDQCDASGTNKSTACSQHAKTGGNLLLQTRSLVERLAPADEEEGEDDQPEEIALAEQPTSKNGRWKWTVTDNKLVLDLSGPPPCTNARDGVPSNQRPGLIPPEGSAWRGSTIGWSHDEGMISEYQDKYGVQLQMYRFFSKNPITLEMRRFVKAGGILWYNIVIMDWKGTVKGKEDDRIDYHAAMVKSFAPALVLVCVSHEPDHDVDDKSHTAQDFRDMWDYVQTRFKNYGTPNAVWSVDFSTGLERAVVDPAVGHTHQWENALAVWPGADKVDWLFFNLFERGMDPRLGNTFAGMFTELYQQLEAAEGCAVGSCAFSSVPWGVGAFGTATESKDGATAGKGRDGAVLLADEKVWLDQASDLMATHPNIKAYVYFDSLHSSITEELKPAYMQYLQSPFFTANDPDGTTYPNTGYSASEANEAPVDVRRGKGGKGS